MQLPLCSFLVPHSELILADRIRSDYFSFFFFKVVQHEGMSGHPLVLPFMRGWRAHGVLVVSAGEVQGSGGCT